jgi:hypothetical protein
MLYSACAHAQPDIVSTRCWPALQAAAAATAGGVVLCLLWHRRAAACGTCGCTAHRHARAYAPIDNMCAPCCCCLPGLTNYEFIDAADYRNASSYTMQELNR